MRELTVNLGERSYPIYIGKDLYLSGDLYKKLAGVSRLLVVTDSNVEKLYLSHLLKALSGMSVSTHVVPAGEAHKSLDSLNEIITVLLTNKFSRSDCLLAFGGGVIGDLAGFAAACYQRGIDFIQVPTTLLAQVDSAVGGKTAVNHEMGKNMIGAFHQPRGVVADVGILETLPEREFSAGLAEVIKYGLIRDREFFDWLDASIDKLVARQAEALEYAIERSCRNKADVVAEDERETGIRAILNLGHTFGHAIETGLQYRVWLHGEAVGMGILMASYMSQLGGQLDASNTARINSVIQRAGLPMQLPRECVGMDLRELMSVDKKTSHGKLKLVLLQEIGKAVITSEFDESVLLATLKHFMDAA